MTNSKFGPLNQDYMSRISDIISKATKAHARTSVFTFVLRLPEYRDTGDSIASAPNLNPGLMERFRGALKSRIAAHQHRLQRVGSQVCPTDLRNLWVHEVGSYKLTVSILAGATPEAWLSALGLLDFPEYRTLVSFNNTPHYLESLRVDRFGQQYLELRRHLSYFAKEHTKAYSKEDRSFGGSVR